MTIMIVAQLIGLLAMGLDVYATLHKPDKHLIRIHSIGSMLFALHYFLLGAIPGALSELLNGTRAGLSSFTKSRLLAFAFLFLYIALLFIIPENALDTLPFLSSILITIGIYFFHGISMRLFYICGFMLWLIYSIYVMSIGGIIVFLILILTSSITIRKLIQSKSS